MMNNLTTKTIREIALEMPLTTKVFETYKIDYCCGGYRNFSEACEIAGVETESVLLKISECLKTSDESELAKIQEASLKDLIDHIEKTHHVFTRDEIKNLVPLMIKVANKHGEHNPYLFALEELFSELCADLAPHLLKEEQVLFPYITQLENYKNGDNFVSMPCFGSVKNPVGMMLREHDSAGDVLRKMRAVSNNYEIPEGACPSFTALFTRLEAFEKDLHRHIHLENNVLFPRAIALENEIFELKN
ncbi:MAG TPA: iron-sulfur cluster repair di-iron protein [Pyrinomonadaceae bacterium]|nr:iron-sulfur cluster repair di-iron protein [Pyrinomonadaceae bacterium]